MARLYSLGLDWAEMQLGGRCSSKMAPDGLSSLAWEMAAEILDVKLAGTGSWRDLELKVLSFGCHNWACLSSRSSLTGPACQVEGWLTGLAG